MVLEPAGDGWGGFRAWFEESLADSRREEQFCREQRHSMELRVSLSSTRMSF